LPAYCPLIAGLLIDTSAVGQTVMPTLGRLAGEPAMTVWPGPMGDPFRRLVLVPHHEDEPRSTFAWRHPCEQGVE
jgi:hypothetical protein